jgi:SAM-dependent methyltransferase
MFDTYADIFMERAREYHSAMRRAPRARDAEFRSVLQPIADAPDGLVCDMPSGGCYLASYVPERMRYVGVEPVETFLNSSEDGIHRVNAPITDVPLADGSVDYVISLAGLHHEESLGPIFREMRRLVRRGGCIVIADAAADSAVARFLNGFVADHNPMGHDGRFLDEHTRGLIEGAGLTVVEDELVSMPWRFDRPEDGGAFCGELFGLAGVDVEAVTEALDRDIGFDIEGGHARLRWALRRIFCQVE